VGKLDYSKENMDVLADQLRLGCEDTRTRMIEGYMPLVRSKVKKWVTLYPSLEHLKEDMTSEGDLAVVRAIDSIKRGERPDSSNVTGYVSVSIVNAIGEFLDTSTLIRIPRWTDETCPVIETLYEVGLQVQPPNEEVELRDLLDTVCQSDQDRAIVDLLSRGYTEREVASQLDMAQQTVNMLKLEIHERYTRLERG
jgi:RNA polymerase sigma factor (sigma-70 family)